MSKRRLRRKSCEGKRRYASKTAAERAAYAAEADTGERLHAYACRFGDHFHVGHPTRRARQAHASLAGWRRRTA